MKTETYCITATICRDIYLDAKDETDAKIKAEKIISDELSNEYKIMNIE